MRQFRRYYISLNQRKMEEEEIQSFSETPGASETKEDLDEAEKENTEVQEQAEEENKPDDMEETQEEGSTEDAFGASEGETTEESSESSPDTSTPNTSESSDTTSEEDNKSEEEKDKESDDDSDEHKEKIKENGGDEGSEMSYKELYDLSPSILQTIRFISPNLKRTDDGASSWMFDYGTPAGTEDQPSATGNSCPSCDDAADAAIIDAEIAPSEGSGEETGPIGGNSNEGGGDAGGDEFGDEFGSEDEGEDAFSMKKDIKDFINGYKAQCIREAEDVRMFGTYSKYYVPGMEDWATLGGEAIPAPIVFILKAYMHIGLFLMKVVGRMMLKAAKYGRKVYLIARKHMSNTFMKMETVYKLWKFKLSNNLDKVNAEELDHEEVEAFPFPDWVEACKIGLATFDIVRAGERLIFEKADDELTSALTQYKEKLDNAGIVMDPAACSINPHEFMDRRKHASVNELGFTKSNMPTAMNYFGDIAKRMDARKKEIPLQAEINKCIMRLGQETKNVNERIKRGELDKEGPEYKEINKHLANYAIRLAFVTSCMELTYGLLNVCVKDIQRVLAAYEDCFDPKFLTK